MRLMQPIVVSSYVHNMLEVSKVRRSPNEFSLDPNAHSHRFIVLASGFEENLGSDQTSRIMSDPQLGFQIQGANNNISLSVYFFEPPKSWGLTPLPLVTTALNVPNILQKYASVMVISR